MATTTYTDDVIIDGSQDEVQLTVQGHSTQNEPLQTWEDSAGTVQAQITVDGSFQNGDAGVTTEEALIEAHRADGSSLPLRGFHSLGKIGDALGTAISWSVHELFLLGTNALSTLHTALRVRLRNENTGTMSGVQVYGADIEVQNAGGGSANDVPEMVGLHVQVENESTGYLDLAAGLKVEMLNAGSANTLIGLDIPDVNQGTDNYAIRTGAGKVEHGSLGAGLVKSDANGVLINAIPGTDYDSPISLDDLSDVNASAPSDGQPLVWDNTNSLWKPGSVTASGLAINFQDLVDVNNLYRDDGALLKWSSVGAMVEVTNPATETLNAWYNATSSSSYNNMYNLFNNTAQFPLKITTVQVSAYTTRDYTIILQDNSGNELARSDVFAASTGTLSWDFTNDGVFVGVGESIRIMLSADANWITRYRNASTITGLYATLTLGNHYGALVPGMIIDFEEAAYAGSPKWEMIDIDKLSDVDTTSTPPTNGQALLWDGVAWKPGNVAASGGSGGGNGLYDAYAEIQHTGPTGVDAGATSSASYQTFPLSTKVADNDGIAQIGVTTTDTVTLEAGDYYIEAEHQIYMSDRTFIRIYNVSTGAAIIYGVGQYVQSSSSQADLSQFTGEISSNGSDELRFEVYTQTGKASNGFGIPKSIGETEIFGTIRIWRKASGNQAPSLITVSERQAAGVNGGAAVVGIQTRTLNTLHNPDSVAGVSLTSNQLTLPAGKYRIKHGSAPSYATNRHQIFIYSVTDSIVLQDDDGNDIYGTSQYVASGVGAQTNSIFQPVEFTLVSSKVLELRHYVQTARATNGLGVSTNIGTVEIYGILSLEKLS